MPIRTLSAVTLTSILAKYEEAIADYTRALDLDPNVDTYTKRGVAYFKLNKYEAALADYTRALDLDSNADRYTMRGDTCFMLKKYEEAIADYTRALDLDPNADTYTNRGIAYGRLNKHEAALVDFKDALGLDRNFAPAYAGRGDVYINLNKYEKAIANYTRALDLDSNAATYTKPRCRLWLARTNTKKLPLQTLHQSLKTLTPNAATYTSRGATYGKLKKYKAAIADFNKALDLDSSLLITHFVRGTVYFALGLEEKNKGGSGVIENYKEALKSLNKAKNLAKDRIGEEAYGLHGYILTELAIGIETKKLSISELIIVEAKPYLTAEDFFTQAFYDFKKSCESQTFSDILSINKVAQITSWHEDVKMNGTLDDDEIIKLLKLYFRCA